MLHFNKLRLSGFKSFVDNTELTIDLGLTGVVGPNGCGKSNLVEALRWVMGETSAKQMRGGDMDDVIFGGTSTRPQRNVAEVVLGLDNLDRTAPAQFNQNVDLDVSRRIQRGKGSAYRVNGKDVRARDVQLLFADSSTGARSTALVSQGRIGTVINAKPTERRGLLEEAAGISGLHSRRHEAELRLRAAEANLERLEDILLTLDTQLDGLKKQTRQANRYQNLNSHIRIAEATLFHLHWFSAEQELEKNRKILVDVEAAVTELTVVAGKASIKQAECAEALPALRQKEAEAGAELQRLSLARESLQAEEGRISSAINGIRRQFEQTETDRQREASFANDSGAAIERLEQEKTQIVSSQEGEDEARTSAVENLARINESVTSLDKKLGLLTQEIATTEALKASLDRRYTELDTRHQRLTARSEELSTQYLELQTENLDETLLEQASDKKEEAQKVLSSAREAHETSDQKRQTSSKARQQAGAERQESHTELARLEAEENALSKVLATGNEGQWPSIIDTMTVNPGYESALGIALGEDLSASADQAAPVHWSLFSISKEGPPLPKGTTSLRSLVDGPKVLNHRLDQIGVVDTDAEGAALASSLLQGQRLVTKTGSLWRWDGFTISSGATTSAAIRLEQRNRLLEITDQVDSARKKFNAAELKASDAKEYEEKAHQSERQSREGVTVAERTLRTAQEHQLQVRDQTAARTSRLTSLRDSQRSVADDLLETTTRIKEITKELENITDPADQREMAAAIRMDLSEKRREQVEFQSQHDNLERLSSERKKRLLDLAQEISTWRQRSESASQQIQKLAERKTGLENDLERLSARPAQIELKRNQLIDSIATSEQNRTVAGDALAQAENWLREAEAALREGEAALGQAREQMIRVQGTVSQSQQVCHGLAERVKDRLECRPDQLSEIAGIRPDEPLPNLEAVEKKVERLLKERDTIGPVNLRAEQETQELGEQIKNLGDERDDLIKAIEKLRQGIAELNREGRQRLLKAFDEVDTHFQGLFIKLFGGGRAHLKLTESDDPLSSGLEIFASPPGKNLQVLSLLSGGEQALTALALLFGVFLTNPAPICVLDEVDAPLDDANVDRFCNLLDEMSQNQKTRFLVITHHRMTMARMDRLFGVTMSERGVSQLVSVDLHQAELIRNSDSK